MVLYETLSGQSITPQNVQEMPPNSRPPPARRAPPPRSAQVSYTQQAKNIYDDNLQLILWIITTCVLIYVLYKHYSKKNKKAKAQPENYMYY